MTPPMTQAGNEQYTLLRVMVTKCLSRIISTNCRSMAHLHRFVCVRLLQKAASYDMVPSSDCDKFSFFRESNDNSASIQANIWIS
uniref:Innexin n=1 Tax=Parascaris univalens TaxID=6257 RepID=A0A915B1C4_PARUN